MRLLNLIRDHMIKPEYENIKRIMRPVELQELQHMLSELKKPFCSRLTEALHKNSIKLRGDTTGQRTDDTGSYLS